MTEIDKLKLARELLLDASSNLQREIFYCNICRAMKILRVHEMEISCEIRELFQHLLGLTGFYINTRGQETNCAIGRIERMIQDIEMEAEMRDKAIASKSLEAPSELWLLWTPSADHPSFVHAVDDPTGRAVFLACFSESDAIDAAKNQERIYGLKCYPFRTVVDIDSVVQHKRNISRKKRTRIPASKSDKE